MKRLFCLLLTLLLALSISGCAKQNSGVFTSDAPYASSELYADNTSLTDTTTTSNVTSIAPSSSTTVTSFSSKPVSTSSANGAVSSPVYIDPGITASKPQYTGTYIEDTQILDLSLSYSSLKAELEPHIKASNPTKTSGETKFFDLRDNFKKYSLFGYYINNYDGVECNALSDLNNNLTGFTCSVTAAYKDSSFAEAAVLRDIKKMTEFAEEAEIQYFIAFTYGNPDDYKSFDAIPERYLRRIYSGLAPDDFVNIQFLNQDKSVKCMFTFGCVNNDGVLEFTSKATVYF